MGSRTLSLTALVVMGACVDPTAIPHSQMPQLSSTHNEVVGQWHLVESGFWALVCPVELTIHAPRPIKIEGGDIGITVYRAAISQDGGLGYQPVPGWRQMSAKELATLVGNPQIQGTRKIYVALVPPVYNAEYDASVSFDWSLDDRARGGQFGHSWKCLEP